MGTALRKAIARYHTELSNTLMQTQVGASPCTGMQVGPKVRQHRAKRKLDATLRYKHCRHHHRDPMHRHFNPIFHRAELTETTPACVSQAARARGGKGEKSAWPTHGSSEQLWWVWQACCSEAFVGG